MSFAELRAAIKKYGEIAVFGISFGISLLGCTSGVVAQCVSLAAIVTKAVN